MLSKQTPEQEIKTMRTALKVLSEYDGPGHITLKIGDSVVFNKRLPVTKEEYAILPHVLAMFEREATNPTADQFTIEDAVNKMMEARKDARDDAE